MDYFPIVDSRKKQKLELVVQAYNLSVRQGSLGYIIRSTLKINRREASSAVPSRGPRFSSKLTAL